MQLKCLNTKVLFLTYRQWLVLPCVKLLLVLLLACHMAFIHRYYHAHCFRPAHARPPPPTTHTQREHYRNLKEKMWQQFLIRLCFAMTCPKRIFPPLTVSRSEDDQWVMCQHVSTRSWLILKSHHEPDYHYNSNPLLSSGDTSPDYVRRFCVSSSFFPCFYKKILDHLIITKIKKRTIKIKHEDNPFL